MHLKEAPNFSVCVVRSLNREVRILKRKSILKVIILRDPSLQLKGYCVPYTKRAHLAGDPGMSGQCDDLQGDLAEINTHMRILLVIVVEFTLYLAEFNL